MSEKAAGPRKTGVALRYIYARYGIGQVEFLAAPIR